MLSPRGEVIVRYLGVVVAFTVAHNLFSAVLFRGGTDDVRRTSDIQSRDSIQYTLNPYENLNKYLGETLI